MAYIKPQSPIINWGHPLTKGLVFDGAKSERKGISTFDTVLGTKGTLTNTPTWGVSIVGGVIDYSGGSNRKTSFTTKSQVNGLLKGTLEYMFVRTGTGGLGYGVIMSKSNGATRNWHVENDNGDSGWGHTFQLTFTSGHGKVWSIDYPTNNVWYHHVITFDYDRTSTPTIYVNGVSVGLILRYDDTAGGDSPTTDGTDLTLGNEYGATQNWGGSIAYNRVWNRKLTATEVRQLYQNPWQIYLKPNFVFAYPSVSSTSIKTVNGLAVASVKTVNGLAIASVKTINGLA